jgi:hypothetical protein
VALGDALIIGGNQARAIIHEFEGLPEFKPPAAYKPLKLEHGYYRKFEKRNKRERFKQ